MTNGTATIVDSALAQIIANDPEVDAICAGRVYPASNPQPVARPKVTYHQWGEDDSDGGFTNDGPTGYTQAKFLIDSWADDTLTSKQLANAVKKAINGYVGTVGQVNIQMIHVVDKRDQPGQVIPGAEIPVQRTTLDVRITATA